MPRPAAWLVLLLTLCACGRGPDTRQAVGPDLAARLAQAFGAGVLDVAAIEGRGSSTDRTGPPGEERRVVYYDARLRLARDVDFGGWDTPGVASLVSVLGAGPKGITGVKAGGSKESATNRGAARWPEVLKPGSLRESTHEVRSVPGHPPSIRLADGSDPAGEDAAHRHQPDDLAAGAAAGRVDP